MLTKTSAYLQGCQAAYVKLALEDTGEGFIDPYIQPITNHALLGGALGVGGGLLLGRSPVDKGIAALGLGGMGALAGGLGKAVSTGKRLADVGDELEKVDPRVIAAREASEAAGARADLPLDEYERVSDDAANAYFKAYRRALAENPQLQPAWEKADSKMKGWF